MFSMTGCVLIWNAAFNWLGVVYLSCLYSSVDVLAVRN